MTVTEFLDTKLDKDTDDVIFTDVNQKKINIFNYEDAKVKTVYYKKIAVVNII